MKTTINGKEVELVEDKDAILRNNGAINRPILPNWLKNIPFNYYVFVAIALVVYFVGRGMIDDAKNLGIAEEKERQAAISKQISLDYQAALYDSWHRESKTLKKYLDLMAESNKKIETKKKQGETKKAKVNAKHTPIEVAADVKEFLNIEPEITSTGSIAFSVEQVKAIINTQIDKDTLITELEETQHQLAMEKERSTILAKQVEDSKTALSLANKALDDMQNSSNAYKKAAKKSFGQKLWSGTKKVGGYVAVAAVVIVLTQ